LIPDYPSPHTLAKADSSLRRSEGSSGLTNAYSGLTNDISRKSRWDRLAGSEKI